MISGTDDEFEGKKPKKSSKPAAKQPKTWILFTSFLIIIIFLKIGMSERTKGLTRAEISFSGDDGEENR